MKYSPIFLLTLSSIIYPGMIQRNPDKKSAGISFIEYSKIDKAQELSRGSGSVIAVMDWAFDLKGREVEKYIFPVDLVKEENRKVKPWHGEWMAEIIHTIAPDAMIIPIKARGLEIHYQDYVAEGIRYAADHGAVAVTSSMGPLVYTNEIAEAIDYAESRGTVFINVHPEQKTASADKKEWCNCDPRIIHTGIVSVPEHPVRPDSLRQVYTWPYDIDPVFEDGWGYSNGPPIVAGVIALMKSICPEITPETIREILLITSKNINGFNVLDAESALSETERLMKLPL